MKNSSLALGSVSILLVVLLILIGIPEWGLSEIQLESEYKLQTIEKMTPYIDIPNIHGLDNTGRIVLRKAILEDVLAPFASDIADDNRLMNIRIRGGLGLLLNSESVATNDSGEISILIDSTSGKVINISIQKQQYETTSFQRPSAKDAQRQIQAAGESYVGFPDDPPGVTFGDIMGAAKNLVRSAELIEATFVDWKFKDKEPRPVWIVSLWGLSERYWHVPHGVIGVSYEELKKFKDQDHQRLIFDATSGKLIMKTNIPRIQTNDSVDGE